MSQHSVSEDPKLIPPSGPNYRLIGAIAVGLLIIGLIAAVPLTLAWQKEQAAHVERGELMGAVYDIDLGGQPTRLELGWAGPHLAILAEPALPEDVVIHVSGDFGKEALSWNPEARFFGPTRADLNPMSHYPVKLRIEQDGRTLWTGKKWAWGFPESDHHH